MKTLKRRKKAIAFRNEKVMQARQKNEYLRQFKTILDAVAGRETYSLIPSPILEVLFKLRIPPFKVVVPDKPEVSGKTLNFIKMLLLEESKHEKFKISYCNLDISLYDFTTIGLTIKVLQRWSGEEKSISGKKIERALEDYDINFTECYDKYLSQLCEVLFRISIILSQLDDELCWFDCKLNLDDQSSTTGNLITLHTVTPPTLNVNISGLFRPVRKIGWALPLSGPVWVGIHPSDLNLGTVESDEFLDVYIQSHALRRLTERIDCFPEGLVHFYIFKSLLEPKAISGEHCDFLIEFRFNDFKTGYFVADLIDKKIIIRTFLFITNNGTPEGKKLEKNTGLKMADKKYLAIDKLSTFIQSDLNQHEEMKKIFHEAGCQGLLDLCKKSAGKDLGKPNSFQFSLMSDYLDARC